MDIGEFHALLAVAFELPDYYGKNWEAFEECIYDDEVSNPPTKLILEGWDHFSREHLEDAKLFWSCIDKQKETKKPTDVLVTSRGCPCFGYLSLSDWNSGSLEIFAVCNWGDDDVQFRDPEYEGGANIESLNQARAKFSGKYVAKENVREFRAIYS